MDVIVSARMQNLEDLYSVQYGRLASDAVRTLFVTDALAADTTATGLMIPTRLLVALGLRPSRRQHARSVGGDVVRQWYDPVCLTVGDSVCCVEVCEVPDGEPVQIGMIPLNALGLVIDRAAGELSGGPEHIMDVFAVCV